jgi:hypothetical protein
VQNKGWPHCKIGKSIAFNTGNIPSLPDLKTRISFAVSTVLLIYTGMNLLHDPANRIHTSEKGPERN